MALNLSNLKPNPGARKRVKRVGRGPGSGNGKTSGSGHKGQQARSGYSRRIGFEGGQNPFHRRIPQRGFRHTERHPVDIVNVDVLEASYNEGETVNLETLTTLGLAKGLAGGVKVLGRGEVTKKLNVAVQAITDSAKEKIEKAGGTVQIVSQAPEAKSE
jgi:large subunit ribosomal protein L15